MKSASLGLLFAAAILSAESPRQIPAPFYTASSIVNAGSAKAEPLAPGSIVTLYGRDLGYSVRALEKQDISGNMLPTVLSGTGVRVNVSGLIAGLYYVSPNQINFIMPLLQPGDAEIRVVRDGLYGPGVRMQVRSAAPALFQMDPEFAVVTRADGSVITRDSPASPGEIVILYATGLGLTRPRSATNEIPTRPAPLERLAEFTVQVGGRAATVLYAGVAPGFAGLYQINAVLPDELENDPEIRIGFPDAMSPPDVRLPAAGRDPG